MILGYRQSVGGSDAYHFGMIGGGERKFIRMIVGAALPLMDRISGAAVAIGETYRASGPASWVILQACCGSWGEVENTLAQWRKDLKFNYIVVESEAACDIVFRMRGMTYGINEINLGIYEAPTYFDTEIGRSYVDSLIYEDRLVIPEYIQHEMRMEPTMSKAAIQAAMCWAREWRAYYAPLKQPGRGTGDILGMEGL